jgi:hypothetical protein
MSDAKFNIISGLLLSALVGLPILFSFINTVPNPDRFEEGFNEGYANGYIDGQWNAKREGYIIFPPAYNSLNEGTPNVIYQNNGTNADLNYADNKTINMTITNQVPLVLGWQVFYVVDDMIDLINCTLNFTIYVNRSMDIELLFVSAPLTSFANISLVEGWNVIDNITLIGESGIYENSTRAEQYPTPLVCSRNGLFQIQFKMPSVSSSDHYNIAFDQVVCNFYATKLASHLFTQFFEGLFF